MIYNSIVAVKSSLNVRENIIQQCLNMEGVIAMQVSTSASIDNILLHGKLT